MAEPTPIWIRMPAPVKDNDGKTVVPARCQYTGLSAAKLFTLCVRCPANKFNPPVRSVSVPTTDSDSKKKSKKGRFVRLIHLPSLLAYLDALAEQQSQEVAA